MFGVFKTIQCVFFCIKSNKTETKVNEICVNTIHRIVRWWKKDEIVCLCIHGCKSLYLIDKCDKMPPFKMYRDSFWSFKEISTVSVQYQFLLIFFNCLWKYFVIWNKRSILIELFFNFSTTFYFFNIKLNFSALKFNIIFNY